VTKSNGSSARDLAGIVRRCRASAGLTQAELAVRTGMSLGAVRDLEQGRTTRPHRRSLNRLAAGLGVDPPDWDELVPAAAPARPAPELAADELWLGLLGPLTARRGPVPVVLRSARQRALLGLLALDPATGVHRDAIVDTLWPQDPPPSAIAIIWSQVSLLRRQLDPSPSAPSAARPGDGMARRPAVLPQPRYRTSAEGRRKPTESVMVKNKTIYRHKNLCRAIPAPR
jgi:transcriptional regulator with XRE-family HTH domain